MSYTEFRKREMVFEREEYLKLSHTRNRGERSYKRLIFMLLQVDGT
jgi:hypothetical protein